MTATTERWSGRIGFILATIGSAVGLGSIWKFPYEVASNGGSAFVLVYLLGLALIVVPLLMVEFTLGRRGRGDAASSIRNVAAALGAQRSWAFIGHLGVASAFLILSFYAVIGGWTVAFAVDTLHGHFALTANAAQARFDALMAAPGRMALYQALFLGISALIVARGIAGGIELAVKLLMPVLVVLIVILAVYAVIEGDAAQTVRFLFAFDVAKLTPQVALEALGLGFFSIGVGLGVMIVYAAYGREEFDLRQVAIATVLGDTAISLLAGFAIFPIVFAEGLDLASGPGLMFVTLPIAFSRMPFGIVAEFAFFLLLAVAALVSAISLLEMPVALLMRRLRWSRPAATIISAGATFVFGLGTVFSFNLWKDVHLLAALPGFRQATFYDVLDHLTSNLMLPLGGFGLAILAGWVLPSSLLSQELGLSERGVALIRLLLRFVVPAGIAAATVTPLFA